MPDTITTSSSVGFRRLMEHLSERIGQQHFPVRSDARDIHELLAFDAVHHELVKDLVRSIYRLNRCNHLDAAVNSVSTFTALGEMRQRLNQSPRTDIDQINLLEDIGWTVRQIFFNEPARIGSADRGAGRGQFGPEAPVRSISVDLH